MKKNIIMFFRMEEVLMALRYYYAASGESEKEWAAVHAKQMQMIRREPQESNLEPVLRFRGIEVVAEDVLDAGKDSGKAHRELEIEVIWLRNQLDLCLRRPQLGTDKAG